MMKIVEIVKKNKTIWLLGIFMGIFFSGVNALGRYLNGAASEGLPGILRTFFLWFPVVFVVSSLLLAGIRRGADWISGTWLNKISVEILNGKKSFWIGWGVIFLLWLPALLASWPGVYVIDNVSFALCVYALSCGVFFYCYKRYFIFGIFSDPCTEIL